MDIFTHPHVNNDANSIDWLAPSLPELAVFVNRKLRFQYPVPSQEDIKKTFLLKQCQSTGVSKTTLAEMPSSLVDYYVAHLACQVLNIRPETIYLPDNMKINLAILSMLGAEFDLNQWMKDDIARLAGEPSVGLHVDFYSEEKSINKPNEIRETGFTSEQIAQVLVSHHYRTDWLNQFDTLAEGYLACRMLTYPFPWQAFIETLNEEMQQYLNINTLYRVLQFAGELLQDEDNPQQFYQKLTGLFQTPYERMPQTGLLLTRPYKMLILVEGKTEKKVLPVLAKLSGLDFERHRIHLMASGGKNQMIKLYSQLSESSALPILILLDHDAAPIADEIKERLRENDHLTLLEDGEFEDLYDEQLILESINQGYAPYPELTAQDLEDETSSGLRINQFKTLWKEKDLGSFDKIHFADQVISTLKETGYIPPRLQKLMTLFKAQYHQKTTNGDIQ